MSIDDDAEFDRLLDDSNLGSPAAQHIQSQAPDDLDKRVVVDVTVMAVAFYDVGRADERLSVFVDHIVNLAKELGMHRPVVSSETHQALGFIERGSE